MNHTLIYKYSIGEDVWFVDNQIMHYGKILLMESSVSIEGDITTYCIVNGTDASTISEDMVFPTAELALQYIIDNRT